MTSLAPLANILCPLGRAARRGGVESAYCLGLDGVNDYVDSGSPAILDFGTGDFAVAVWGFANALPPNNANRFIVTKANRNSSPYPGWDLGMENLAGVTKFRFQLGPLANVVVRATDSPSIGSWYFLVAQRFGDTIEIYVNGRLAGTATGAAAKNVTTSTSLQIGRGNDAVNYWSGAIDDLRIYNRAITAAEVQTLYRNSAAPPTSGLVAYFPLEEGTGTTTTDTVGGFVGTLTNGPTWQPQTPTRLVSSRISETWSITAESAGSRYVNVPHNSALSFTTPFSISAWVKSTGNSNYAYIAGKADASDFNGYYLTINPTSGYPTFYILGAASYKDVVIQKNIANDATWHHVVGTWDGASLNVWLDGIPGPSASYSPLTSNTSPFRIGGSNYAGRCFNGLIKDVRAYSGVLADASIRALSKGKEPGDSYVARWRINEGSGSTAAEENGLYPGTVVNSAPWTGDVPQWFRQTIESSQALSCDGVDDRLTLPTAGLQSSTVSLAIWIYRDGNQFVYALAGGITDGGYYGYRMWFPGTDYLRWGLNHYSSGPHISFGTIPNQRWTRCVGVYDGTNIRAYVNGVQVATAAAAAIVYTNTEGAIGYLPNWSYLKGSIDDACFFNRALSDAEILDDAAGYLVPASLVSRFRLDGNANDAVGSNNGTEQGGVGYSTSVPGTL